MSNSQNNSTNSPFVSIRYVSSKEVLPNANEREKIETTFVDIAAVRRISRIVEQIRRRIAGGGAVAPGDRHQSCPAGDRGGSTTPSSNCSKNSNPEEKK